MSDALEEEDTIRTDDVKVRGRGRADKKIFEVLEGGGELIKYYELSKQAIAQGDQKYKIVSS